MRRPPLTTPPPVSPWLGLVGILLGCSVVVVLLAARRVLYAGELRLLPVVLLGAVQVALLLRLNRMLVRRDLDAWPGRSWLPTRVHLVGSIAFLLLCASDYRDFI